MKPAPCAVGDERMAGGPGDRNHSRPWARANARDSDQREATSISELQERRVNTVFHTRYTYIGPGRTAAADPQTGISIHIRRQKHSIATFHLTFTNVRSRFTMTSHMAQAARTGREARARMNAGVVPPRRRDGDRLRGAPILLVNWLILLELTAFVLTAAALATETTSGQSWLRAALLLGTSVVFEEISSQVGKARLVISSGPKPDMTSVWTFAAALALYPGQAALLAAAVCVHVWFRRQRASGQYAYRKIYSGATVVLACLAASSVLHRGNWAAHAGPNHFGYVSVLLTALVIYTATNRVLISVALVLSGGPRTVSALIGSWEDNSLEVATLCLGFFTSLALVDQPLLAPLMIVPTLLLQRGALVKELERAAATDTKTQLLTALAWEQIAKHQLSLAIATSAPAAVLLIDLDRFKQVNDTHGHLVGDAALLKVGDRLKRELRQTEAVGRFGGEEFVVLLPGLDAKAALGVAERIRARIESIDMAEPGTMPAGATEAPRLSASIGLACYPQHGSELSDLLHAADIALYTAKRLGRNRVELAMEPGSRDGSTVGALG
jgi:diguanylate cyclase (GGDEF)-like protein